MNGQLFMRREKEAGGEDALPQWISVILTSLWLYYDVLHEEAATGPQTALLYSLCMHSGTAQSLKVTTLMCYFTAPYSCQHTQKTWRAMQKKKKNPRPSL